MADPNVPRRVVVTSIVRYAFPTAISGWLRVLDLERKRESFVTVVPESMWRKDDPNPRGGTRGVRGVSVHGGRIVLASAERLFVLDQSWQFLGEISHRLMADTHDILAEERGVWATSTGCDTLLLVGWDGQLEQSWELRENRPLMEELGSPGSWLPPLDPAIDYRNPRITSGVYDALHLNGLAPSPDGLLLSFGRVVTRQEEAGKAGTSVLARFTEDRVAGAQPSVSVVLEGPGVTVPNHNVAEDGDLFVYNDSNRNCLVAFDRETGSEVRAVRIPGKPPYARGLARIGPGLWLVGSQAPLAVYAVDLDRGKVVASYTFDGMEYESVYGICPLPDHFADPRPPAGDDRYAFWKRAALGPGVTPIPI